ncbi:putative Ketoreductase (KR) domain-containing protein [Seiridium cardinale]|uniref:Ketoreductase (KR) domain-containing protein n=1 Tax=Seiridium cardinale TaxID=138064 RepID=A0ABR2XAJ1_9PEZI
MASRPATGYYTNSKLANIMSIIVFTPNIHKPSESGATLARLAIADDMANVSGKYFEGHREMHSSTQSYDEKKHDDVWQWPINYCAENKE